MKYVLYPLLLAITIAAALSAYSVYLYGQPGPFDSAQTFQIEKGNGARIIASNLKDQKLISNDLIFLITLKLKGKGATLKAGEYEIQAHATISDIQNQLIEGRVVQRKFTIPEGRTSFEIVEILDATEGLIGEIKDTPAEGTLLPDTYHFTRDEPRIDKINQMQQAMASVKADLWDKRQKDLPFTTWEEAVTLASIVEKETGVAHERKTIAGVFINRLRQGIPLQSDPTVIYAITKGAHKNEGQGPLGRRLLLKDLQIESPYNTYRNAGLPPGPIANPGKDAIEAVLNPEKNDFIYFVADGTGGHVFAKTLVEHNKNVSEWRKLRRSIEK
ncbi:MAG: endolytic transglycosylase MltG [Pseudobdellovibrionaceae bacterium]|jgi:UPF0755 protein|nr:endolytic transglycosylase MltG [Pseudobdellovibrionaceae bacterium]